MDKRKLDGIINISSPKQQIHKSDVNVHESCEKSRASHLAELVLRQAGRLADEISGEVQNFKAYINCCM